MTFSAQKDKKIKKFQYRRYSILRIRYLILFDTVRKFKISTFDLSRYDITRLIGIENCILRTYYQPLCSWLALQVVIYLHIEQRCRQSGEGICRFCDPIYTHECKRHNPDHHQHCLESHRAILGCSPRSCSRSRQRFRFLVHVCLQSIILGCIMIHSLICSSYNCGLDYRSLKQDDLRFSGRILQHRSNFFLSPFRCGSSTGPQISQNCMGRRQHRALRSLSQTLTHDLIGKSGKCFNDKDTKSLL